MMLDEIIDNEVKALSGKFKFILYFILILYNL